MPTLPAIDFLTATERAAIRSAVDSASGDAHLGATSITYRRVSISGGGSATFNVTTGAVTDPYTSSSITALVGSPEDRDATRAGVEISVTDRKFLINAVDLAAEPKSGDVLVYDEVTYDVVKGWKSEAAQLYVAYCRVQGGAE